MKSQPVRNGPARARMGATSASSNCNYRKVKKIGQRRNNVPTDDLDARFREVMDAAPVMIWVSGKDKGCVWFNKPWLKFTGRRLTQELGNGWSEGVHRDDFDRCIKIYSSHFDARKEFRMQYRLRRHDGAYRWIDDTGIPRFARDGTFVGYIGSCIDVHERHKIQSELRRRLLEIAELNRQADTAMLAASIAHEINQPLAAIVFNSSAGLRWLDKETPNVERARGTLNNITRAGKRAVEIIESIRSISKKEHRIHAPLNLNELIQEVLALAEAELHSQNIAVRTTLNENIPDVLADRVQLQQVMLNLINNAIEAMSSVVDSSRIPHIKTELHGSQNIVVTVQDFGTGIDPKNIEQIFDRFFTTKSQGMGMGLAICRSIIEAHNGHLWVEAGVDQGSLFHISLPVGRPYGVDVCSWHLTDIPMYSADVCCRVKADMDQIGADVELLTQSGHRRLSLQPANSAATPFRWHEIPAVIAS